ncbi:MAG TPA: hypothetical protein VMV27_06990 [Candidatus Binataceae bacterium]|nr:hypothetical protein [Candidatus Binataceae bacterium]
MASKAVEMPAGPVEPPREQPPGGCMVDGCTEPPMDDRSVWEEH